MDELYIGPYRVIQRLGEGAFGRVYQAYQPFLDRQVAVKTLHTDLTTDAKIEQQFMQEARTIARLRHPNIVTVHEFGTSTTERQTSTYMVMEYLAGDTLQTVLNQSRLPISEVVNIIEQLAKALDYAHSHNVIHRDLKPANITFAEQGQPVIVDFGLAELMALGGFGSTTPKEAAESTITGTPAYMSPEQAEGQPIGPASDRYGLALIAYEMLSGRLPFSAEDTVSLVLARLKEAPVPITNVIPALPSQLNAVFQRALARNPQDRYPTASAFAAALAEVLLPDRQATQIITVIDPIQAAQLRIARQTVLGFMWGVVLVIFVVILFATAEFLRGFVNADAPFIWDGVVSSAPQPDGLRTVIGLWPGTPAEQSGLQIGDRLRSDIAYDRQSKDGDYTVNGLPRSTYPINWQPQPGDIIQRTVLRDGKTLTVSYPLILSTYQLLVLGIQLPSALVCFLSAIWLIRRWGAEPGVQLFALILLIGCFALVGSGVGNVLVNIDNLALFILLPLLVHFILVFPTPVKFLEDHRRILLLLYLPVPVGLIEFLLGHALLYALGFDLVIYAAYSILILAAIILKWVRNDLRHYRGLRWLISMLATISLIAVLATIIFTYDDIETVRTFWGGNGLNLYYAAYGVIVVGSIVAVLLGVIGYHKLQTQIGPSLATSDNPRNAVSQLGGTDEKTIILADAAY